MSRRHALVTGANRGLGREFARQLLAAGDHVVAACRHPGKATALNALAGEHPGRLHVLPLDLAQPRTHQELARELPLVLGDDARLGLHSTAMRFRDRGKLWISGFYVATVLLWLYAGVGMAMDWPYYVVLAAIAAHFTWQMSVFSIQRPDRSFMLFRSNMAVGVMMVALTTGSSITAISVGSGMFVGLSRYITSPFALVIR